MKGFSIALAVMVLSLGTSAQERVFNPDAANGPPAIHPRKSPQSSTEQFPAVASRKSVKADTTGAAVADAAPDRNADPIELNDKFNWRPALTQSFILLALQHSFRMTEKKTRDELRGPFFRDWKESVQNLEGWDDGGKDFTNYIAHPMQGAVASRIFINNSGKAKRQEFGKQGNYWEGRFKAMAWSALFSLQFEIGPISEASLGNVGQKRAGDGRSKQAYGDIVVTPVVGTAVVVLEDIVDKYLLDRWLEQKISNRLIMKITRSFLTPGISFGNILRGRAPWRRDYRSN